MTDHSRFAIRSAIAAIALGLFMAGRAHAAESPIAFMLAQEAARAPIAHDRVRAAPRARRRFEEIIPFAAPVSDTIAEASRFLGSGNPTGRPGAWCAYFVSFVLERTGHRPLASGMAAAALAYGPRLAGPRVGALAVIADRRGRITHVGLVARVSGESVEAISGNWGHRVARAVLPRWRFAAFIAVT